MIVTQDISGSLTPYAHETLTFGATPGGLTPSKLKPSSTQLQRDFGPARLVLMTLEGAAVRVTIDGTVPVATLTGHLFPIASSVTLANYQEMVNFLAVCETGVGTTAQITYYY